jgi:hypothetical protein
MRAEYAYSRRNIFYKNIKLPDWFAPNWFVKSFTVAENNCTKRNYTRFG